MGKARKIDVSGNSRNESLIENPFNDLDSTSFLKKRLNVSALPKKLEPKSRNVYTTTAFVRREKAGRGGKTVTTISFNPPIVNAEMQSFLHEIKKKCGCGGVMRTDFIEIQGDIRHSLAEFFSKSGIKVKFSGG